MSSSFVDLTIEVHSVKEAKIKFEAFKVLYGGDVTASISGAWKNSNDEYYDLWTKRFRENRVVRFGSKRITIQGVRDKKAFVIPAPDHAGFRKAAYLVIRNY